jgi:hypothetical protein
MIALPWTPLARITDPETSHLAGEDQRKSGRQATHCATVLSIVNRLPALTYRELALEAKLPEAVEVMRRLNDLHKAGLVRPGAQKHKCKVSGRMSTVWYPVAA